ncbi:MAG: phosphate acetyltransferase [Acidimicrobiales bacterium]
MPGTVLVVPTGRGVGLTSACLGLLRAVDRRGIRVGFLKPFAQPRPDGGADLTTELVRLATGLLPPDPIPADRLEHALSAGGLDAVLEEAVGQWQPWDASSDIVIVEGISPGPGHLYSSRVNQALAKALDAKVVLVGSWDADHADPVEHLADALGIAGSAYRSAIGERVVGSVVNRLPPDADTVDAVRAALARRGLTLAGAVPAKAELTWLRVQDLVDQLGARVLSDGDLSRRIQDVAVFAQAVPGGLDVLTDGELVLVPGDRHDVVMAACLAALNGTRLAALLLTVGIEPEPRVWALTRAAVETGLPIVVVDDYTYDAATRVRGLDPELRPDDSDRAEAVTTTVADALDESWLESLPTAPPRRRLSPAAFRYRLTQQAAAADARIVLPEGTEPRTVHAAALCAERGIAHPVLLGPPEEVAACARRVGVELPSAVEVVDPGEIADRYVTSLVEIRRHKGLTEDMAREHLGDPIVVGTMMVHRGEADGLVAGAAHTTADTVRPALQILGTKPDALLVSSVFFMCLPDDVVVYGDCAINPQPNAEELADIAVQSAESARAFGIDPRVAMISFSTGASGHGRDVDKVAKATELVRQRQPDLAVDGPLQYDAAAVASVGESKRPGSPVAGQATVFVFPDLDTGNTTYKAVQRSAGVLSVGPMLQGLAKPVNDLSRGALVEDIVYTVALTAIQAAAAR